MTADKALTRSEPETTPSSGRFSFSTEGFRTSQQFDAWCHFMNDVVALRPPDTAKQGFCARAEACPLSTLMMTRFDLDPMHFALTQEMVRQSGIDHWYLGVVTKGVCQGESRGVGFHAKAGQLILNSYGTPFSGRNDTMSCLGVFFSRDEFADIAEALDAQPYGVLHGPMSAILRDFLCALSDTVDKMSRMEAAATSEAFGHLLRAMFHPSPEAEEGASAPIAATRYHRARRFILNNLKSPDLSPEMISAHLGMSRRQLYYLFEKQGGVAKFLRNKRLSACYTALIRSSEKKLVSSIAYDYGFTNTSTFSRQFQARYGFSPSEARAAWIGNRAPSDFAEETLVDWLMQAGDTG